MRVRHGLQWIRVLFVVWLAVFLVVPQTTAFAGNLQSANVMAPLLVDGDEAWKTFADQLTTVKQYGVDGVSVDVWWGKVEGWKDNNFDWSYYDGIFSEIKAHGLKIIPILSFHRCGYKGNRECDIPLPPWLWNKYNADDLKYLSENNASSEEVVQLWADELVEQEYTDFVTDFKSHFADRYREDFLEINVSLGPSGELRYPSYDGPNPGFPGYGAFQANSSLAIKDFWQEMRKKYHNNLDELNRAWQGEDAVHSFDSRDPLYQSGVLFTGKKYKDTQKGRDVIDWYNQALIRHGERMINIVTSVLGDTFPGVAIGFKVPGVHWTMTDPGKPRAAEVAAGIIHTSGEWENDTTGHGYDTIIALAQSLKTPKRPIVLHFTCLEKDNEQEGTGSFSRAHDLVSWVAKEAYSRGVTIKGENAEANVSDRGWENIKQAFANESYSGFTVLRIGNVANDLGRSHYRKFIRDLRSPGFPSLYIRGTNNAWGVTNMTRSGTVWSLRKVHFDRTGNQFFKFDVYGDWSENYGGIDAKGNAVFNGQNIAVFGDVDITFDETNYSYQVSPSVPGP